MLTQLLVFMQIFKDAREEFCVFTTCLAHGFAAAGSKTMFIHGSFESFFVYIETLFTRDIAGDFEGQTIGGMQFKAAWTIKIPNLGNPSTGKGSGVAKPAGKILLIASTSFTGRAHRNPFAI